MKGRREMMRKEEEEEMRDMKENSDGCVSSFKRFFFFKQKTAYEILA